MLEQDIHISSLKQLGLFLFLIVKGKQDNAYIAYFFH